MRLRNHRGKEGESCEESAAHLTEIYHQANQSLHNLVGNNWSTMQMWVPYLNDMTDEDLIKQYIEKLQKEAGFTEFYFRAVSETR